MVLYAARTKLLSTLSNGETLETRVQDPPRACVGLALLAHPLGRLGGSLHDPLVASLSRHLVSFGFRTVCFNSRGVGDSTGSPSWTGASECQDFQLFLHHSLQAFFGDYSEFSPQSDHNGKVLKLVVVGYSAGGLYASKLDLDAALAGCDARVRFGLVLVSYPLDVMWVLSVFQSAGYTAALARLVQGSPTSSGNTRVRRRSILALFGDQDQFTRIGSYQTWADKLKQAAAAADGAQFEAVRFDGADHFWRSRETLDSVLSAVADWIERI
ncbi:hypothetical protein ACQY0O_000138 [Thecaphora frezii]